MATSKPARVLVAGLGNIFLGDDAFGVEVVRRLSGRQLPEHVRLIDVGVRTVHFAYELREQPYETVILIDAISKSGKPGSLYVLEPEGNGSMNGLCVTDAHAVHAHEVFALVRRLGGEVPRVVIVACEPLRIDPDAGLSPPVAAAVDDAVDLVIRQIAPLATSIAAGT